MGHCDRHQSIDPPPSLPAYGKGRGDSPRPSPAGAFDYGAFISVFAGSPISIMSGPHRQGLWACASAPRLRARFALAARLSAGLAISRAHSMKSFAVGLKVRFLSVVTATGCTEGGSAQGSTLRTPRAAPKRSTEAGMMARKRPVASRLVRTLKE